jgi:hypothetical protein
MVEKDFYWFLKKEIDSMNIGDKITIEKTKKGICYRAMMQLKNKKGKEK